MCIFVLKCRSNLHLNTKSYPKIDIEEKLVNMKVKYICIAGDVLSGLRPV